MKTSFTKSALAGAALSVLGSGAMAQDTYVAPKPFDLYNVEVMRCTTKKVYNAASDAYDSMTKEERMTSPEAKNLHLLFFIADVEGMEFEYSARILREALKNQNAPRTDVEKMALEFAMVSPIYYSVDLFEEAHAFAKKGLITFDADTVVENCKSTAQDLVPEYSHP